MYNVSVPMALMDFVPVAFFGVTAALLRKNLFNKMSRQTFSMFASGTMFIFTAGFLKALWKLLYGLGVCDFQVLNTLFMPIQSIGFLLTGIAAILMLVRKKVPVLAAPPVFAGTMVFIPMMVLGLGTIVTVLSILAAKLNKKAVMVLFILSFLASLAMGGMATQDSTQAWVNWVEQSLNCIGQGLLLWGVLILDRSGLKEMKL